MHGARAVVCGAETGGGERGDVQREACKIWFCSKRWPMVGSSVLTRTTPEQPDSLPVALASETTSLDYNEKDFRFAFTGHPKSQDWLGFL